MRHRVAEEEQEQEKVTGNAYKLVVTSAALTLSPVERSILGMWGVWGKRGGERYKQRVEKEEEREKEKCF